MSKALEGEHYCASHQGNHSHYAEHNCVVCEKDRLIVELRQRCEAESIVASSYRDERDAAFAKLEAKNAELQAQVEKLQVIAKDYPRVMAERDVLRVKLDEAEKRGRNEGLREAAKVANIQYVGCWGNSMERLSNLADAIESLIKE